MSQDKPDLPHDEQDSASQNVSEPDVTEIQTGEEPYAGEADATADSVSAIDELQQALDQAQAEAEQYREQAVRAVAEMENVRKRAQRDVDAARKFALEKFASDLLAVRDSLEMGLRAAEEKGGDKDKLAEGMELTARMFASSMEKFGVEPINPVGETFNPEFHEAVTTKESDEQAPNTVADVMQKGYTLNGRVLRAAMVVVTKAPGKG